MNSVNKKIQKALDALLNSDRVSYIRIEFGKPEYPNVLSTVTDLKLFDLEYCHVKFMVDTDKCVLVIGAGDLT